jgi:hypothetical protein
MAWADSRVMVAVMKKLIADKQSLEVDLKPELAAALLEAKQRLSKKGES